MTQLLAANQVNLPSYSNLLLRLLIDLVALGTAVYLLYFRRHGRRDLVMAFACFNLGLFATLAVISIEHFGAAFGFGLFAILSIVRLRSEPFSNHEVGYFFSNLVLALVNGIDTGHLGFTLLLNAIVLGALYFSDHPELLTSTRRRRLILDEAHEDESILQVVLEERLNVEVRDLEILEVDYVRETTRVDLRYLPRDPAPHPELAHEPASG